MSAPGWVSHKTAATVHRKKDKRAQWMRFYVSSSTTTSRFRKFLACPALRCKILEAPKKIRGKAANTTFTLHSCFGFLKRMFFARIEL